MPKVMVMVASYTVRDHLQAHSQSLWKGGAKYFSEGGINYDSENVVFT